MQVHTLTNHSMWIFSPTSRPRVWAFTLVQHQAFELLVLAAIVFNCVLLAMDDSSVDANSDLRLLLDRTDIAFGVFFLAEMLVKLLAWGGWWCGEQYVNSSLCLDYLRGASVSLCSFLFFVCLVCSLCSLCVRCVACVPCVPCLPCVFVVFDVLVVLVVFLVLMYPPVFCTTAPTFDRTGTDWMRLSSSCH